MDSLTIIISASVAGLVALDKVGIIDKLLKRNGKSNATKNDINNLAENHLHEIGQKLDAINKTLEENNRQHDKQLEILITLNTKIK